MKLFTAKPLWPAETKRIVAKLPPKGIFSTGIEGSDPSIDGLRRNQFLEAHDFYNNYESRLESIRRLGITWLRFGLPYSQAHLGPDQFDFSFSDKVLAKCQQLGITVVADLLHFGLPDWLHERTADTPYFQNSHFPDHFADYAYAFAKRYPHITYYTPVNEPYVTAYFSAKMGIWNEHKATPWEDDWHFVIAAQNIAKAGILARQAIEKVWQEEQRHSEPIFVQNDSFEHGVAMPGSGREAEAARFNLRRFVILDLMFGLDFPETRDYLLRYGMSSSLYGWFMQRGKHDKTILGIDHYKACWHIFDKDGDRIEPPDGPMHLYEVVKIYWERYKLPLLHLEVNAWPDYALLHCRQTYEALCQLKSEGYPILGMAWYGDDLQIGWQGAMHGPEAFNETPVGLFYKGLAQPVAYLFQQFMQRGLVAPRPFPWIHWQSKRALQTVPIQQSIERV